VNISVSRENEPVFNVDLSQEIEGNNGAPLTFFVGRGDSCQIVLDDKQVSREHAKLTYSAGQWVLQKASEFNMLAVNGSNCNESQLKNGDLITIGPFALNVSLKDIPAPIEESRTDEDLGSPFDIPADENPTLSSVDVGLGSDEVTELLDEDLETPEEDDGESLDDPDLSADAETQALDDLGDLDDIDQELGDGEEQFNETQNEFADDFSGEGEEDFSEGFEEGGEEGFDDYGEDYDDNYEVDEYDDEKTQVLKSFANFKLELLGEFAPYDTFIIDKPETFIGRDPEKCDIVLNDPEVSGVHAVIKKNAITCTLEDLKSANGTLLNGERVNSHELTSEDEFLIGSTAFTVKIQSDFIEQEKDRIMPVDENQVVEVQEVVEVDENFEDPDGIVIEGDGLGSGALDDKPKSLFSKEALKDPQQRKKLLYVVVGLLALWVLLDEEEPAKAPVQPKKVVKAEEKKPVNENQKILTPEEKQYVEQQYLLAKQYFEEGKYSETIMELDKIFAITPDYKNAKQIKALAKEGLEKLSRILEEERKEKERKIRELKVKELLVKARKAVKENKTDLAENLFKEILSLDPENFEVTQLKIQINAYKKEQERIALEKAQKEAERKRQLQDLSPGKTYYLSKEWYKAILKLQDFLKGENLDEDLIREASDMLDKSKSNLNKVVNPLIGKARSLKEGQDLKGAYQLYLDILKYHPAHEEALNEMDQIREQLELRSKRVYREAIIAESLSLYNSAKEKFQEVQQISPTDSEYYKKATDKLKDYLD
jgi:pSer/pThr/pTyr-binding forkhead associated (FHA) protein